MVQRWHKSRDTAVRSQGNVHLQPKVTYKLPKTRKTSLKKKSHIEMNGVAYKAQYNADWHLVLYPTCKVWGYLKAAW